MERKKINEEFLLALKKNEATNQIEIDFVHINNPLIESLGSLKKICNNPSSKLDKIVQFIELTPDLNQLSGYYRYCQSLYGAYQEFNADVQATLVEIKNKQNLILDNLKNEEPIKIEKEKNEFKQYLINKFELWGKAYSINIAYRICHEDQSILSFSHRLSGWSNPVYQLTPNFSIELKTNFGYGTSSYFYVKLKFKNIDITPFSEWIDYEIAKFSEINRYTKKYLLENENWLDAMKFSKEACNLSNNNEDDFLEKYVITECEKMVRGLEEIFNKDHFSFKKRNGEHYAKDKKGHVLIEFRGEKISGALDFVSKIIEYDRIAEIKSFIARIESCNRKIQPILVNRMKIIKIELDDLQKILEKLTPRYISLKEEEKIYQKKQSELKIHLKNTRSPDNGELSIVEFNKKFNQEFPEYSIFKQQYLKVRKEYFILSQKIRNLKDVRNNIFRYNEKIIKYFGKYQKA